MTIEQVQLKNYRNFSEDLVEFHSGLNILLGENGQGKTNLIESIYFALKGFSFRFADNHHFIRDGADQSLLRVQFSQKNLQYDLAVQFTEKSRVNMLNGKKLSANYISQLVPIVLFSPESLSFVKDGADQRRELVDEAIELIDPLKVKFIHDYKKALRSRNRILKDHAEGNATFPQTKLLLESLAPTFLKLATEVTWARLELLKAILPSMQTAISQIIRNSSVEISVDYVVSGRSLTNFSKQEIYDAIQKRAQELESAELSSGGSLVGPQRHEIQFLYNQKDSRIYCSQGQQRTIILSFKMAQIVYHRTVHGIYPILLLDDVLSELDLGKQNALVEFLHDIKTQIFLTTTDFKLPEQFRQNEISIKWVKDGQIIKQP